MGGRFAKDDMDAAAFAVLFEAEITTKYHGVWTLFAESPKGFIPVGFVLGFWSHPIPEFAPFMLLGDMIWMPWSTPRNRVEAAVNFFNQARKSISFMEFAQEPEKKFFEMLCKHGVMRRAGTSNVVYRGEAAAIFETVKE